MTDATRTTCETALAEAGQALSRIMDQLLNTANATFDHEAIAHTALGAFQGLHRHAAALEAMLGAIGVNEDVTDAIVDAERGEVPARTAALRAEAAKLEH